MLKWLWVTAVVIVLDQVTKQVAQALLVFEVPVPVIPFFNFTLSYNTGAAFSFLASSAGWQRWFFVVLAVVVSAMIVRWLRRLSPEERWNGVALSLILGGALGNAIDRVFFGHVIDFIDFFYTAGSCMPLFSPLPFGDGFQCHWPAFNLADSAISVGAVIMVLDAILPSKKAAL